MILKDKIVLLTGANGGLGLELIKMFLQKDVKKIYCTLRDLKNVDELKNLSSKIEVLQVDICKTEDVNKLKTTLPSIDILVNNAGANSKKRVLDEASLDFEVNVLGTLNISRAFFTKINKNGLIINITSITALINNPLIALYSASKSALHSITQAMRAEMFLKDVKVLEVLPGPMDTNMTKGREMQKAKTQDVVNEIFEAISIDADEVYPDEYSKKIKKALKDNPTALFEDFVTALKNS